MQPINEIPFCFCVGSLHNERVHEQHSLPILIRPRPRASTTRATSTTPAASASSSHIKGATSHAIVEQALQVLINLQHRGACGCEVNTGDGAGILIQMPDRFLRDEAARLGFTLPPERALRRRARVPAARRRPSARQIEALFERIVTEEGQRVLGWRDVPTDTSTDRPERRRGRAGLQADLHRPRRGAAVGGQVARGAMRASSASCTSSASASSTRSTALDLPAAQKRFFYVVSLSSQHADLQGDADGRPDRADVPRSARPATSSRRSRSCTSASAPTRSRRGRWRTRTATSRTTARSTRCAATSTG